MTFDVEMAAKQTWDVAVVGAGPAGSTVAYALARRGLDVLLVDRASFPRYKVCGCFLNANALATVQSIGLGRLPGECGAVPIHAFQLAIKGRAVRLPMPAGVVLSRQMLDHSLIRAAEAAGAAFLPQTWATLEASRDDVRQLCLHHGTMSTTIQARLILAADGLGGGLLSRAGIAEAPPDADARMGIGVVLQSASNFFAAGLIYMACTGHGYLGLTRLEDGRLDLAGAFDATFIRQSGGPGAAAAETLAEVGWPKIDGLLDHPWRGTPPLTRRTTRLAARRIFVLGDAAGYVEPFTGEGMAWALASAAALAPLAAQAARTWKPDMIGRWQALYRMHVGRRQFLCRAAASLLRRPRLLGSAIDLLRLIPRLAAPIVALLNRPSIAR